MTRKRYSWFLPGLAIALGMTVSAYLLYRHFHLIKPANPGLTDICSVVFGKGCDIALASSWSDFGGISLAGWGFVYYVMLSSLLLSGYTLGRVFRSDAIKGAFFLSMMGSVVSLGLLFLMMLKPVWFCPLCALIHLTNLTLLFLLWRLSRYSGQTLFADLKGAAYFILLGKAKDQEIARWKTASFVLIVFVGLAFYQWVRLQELSLQYLDLKDFEPDRSLLSFAESEVDSISMGTQSPVFGSSQAPVELVIFSDFQCPACRDLAGRLLDLVKRFPTEIKIVFKHFPLGLACNDKLSEEIHPMACLAARAAIAAAYQGKFWSYHDALFRTNLYGASESIFEKIAVEQFALEADRFRTDFHSEAVEQVLRSDIAEGQRLALEGTPALFLNGRRVYDLSSRNLRLLVAFASQKGG